MTANHWETRAAEGGGRAIVWHIDFHREIIEVFLIKLCLIYDTFIKCPWNCVTKSMGREGEISGGPFFLNRRH